NYLMFVWNQSNRRFSRRPCAEYRAAAASGRPVAALVIEAATQFAEWHHDVLAVGQACLQAAIPCLDVRDRRPFDVQFEIAIERGAGRNVGQGEGVAAEERPVREYSIQ